MSAVNDVAKLLIVCPDRIIAYFMQTKLRENVPADCPESWEIVVFDFWASRVNLREKEISKLMGGELSAAVFYDPLNSKHKIRMGIISDLCLEVAAKYPKCLVTYYPVNPNLVPNEILRFGTDERQIDVRTNVAVDAIAQDMAALIKKVAMLPVISGLPADDRKELYNAVEAG